MYFFYIMTQFWCYRSWPLWEEEAFYYNPHEAIETVYQLQKTIGLYLQTCPRGTVGQKLKDWRHFRFEQFVVICRFLSETKHKLNILFQFNFYLNFLSKPCLIRKNEIFIINFLLVWYSLLKKADFFVIFAWLLPGPKLWY